MINRVLRVVTPPATEPVTLEEARLWSQMDPDDESQNAMLLLLITAAREYAENYTNRAYVNRQYELRYPYFPSHDIELPMPPLVSVDYITYTDANGVDQTLGGSPDEFQVELYREPARIKPLYGEVWPSTLGHAIDEVRIGYTAGYGAGVKNIPKALRIWIQQRVTTFDCKREAMKKSTDVALDRNMVDGLLDALVVPVWFQR